MQNLPIIIDLVNIKSGRKVLVPVRVYVDGPTIRLYPPRGTLLAGVSLDGDESSKKIRLSRVTYGDYGMARLSFAPHDLGVKGWAGFYDFQRMQSSLDHIELLVYRQSKRKS